MIDVKSVLVYTFTVLVQKLASAFTNFLFTRWSPNFLFVLLSATPPSWAVRDGDDYYGVIPSPPLPIYLNSTRRCVVLIRYLSSLFYEEKMLVSCFVTVCFSSAKCSSRSLQSTPWKKACYFMSLMLIRRPGSLTKIAWSMRLQLPLMFLGQFMVPVTILSKVPWID